MSMTSMLTGVISLTAKGFLTPVGIITILVWILCIYYNIRKISTYRDPYRIVYILLLTVLAWMFIMCAQPVAHHITLLVEFLKVKLNG